MNTRESSSRQLRLLHFVFAIALTPKLSLTAFSQEKAVAVDPAVSGQIAKLTERLKKSPHDVDALIARGLAYHKARDFEKEQADLQAATQLASNRADAWRAYGEVFFVRNNDKEAIAAFDKAIELGMSDPSAFFERGMAYESQGEREKAIASITTAIQMNPTYADAFFMRGELQKEAGNWEKALADYSQAIEIEPKNLVYRVARAIARFERHEYEKGIEDVKSAMRLNPGDVGVNYEPSTTKKLSLEALAHGEEQVRKMLNDRPAMAQHVTPGDKIWTWAKRKFAGEDLGTLIDWNPGSPEPFFGRSSPAIGERRAFIQVASTRDDVSDLPQQTFDELWSTAVFELHNVASSAEMLKVFKRIERDDVKRDEYILAMLNGEELATQRTRAFYVKVFFPLLQSKRISDTDPIRWCTTAFNTAGDRRSDLAVWGKDPRIPYYGAKFDFVCAYREYQRGDYAKVKILVKPLLALTDSLSRDDLKEVHYWLGYANMGAGDIDAAIEEFTAALGFVPNDASTLLARGIARAKGSQSDKSLADFNEALRIDPKLVGAYYSRGYEQIRRGDLDTAEKDAQAGIKLHPNKSELYGLRGDVRLLKQDFPHAIADYDKAIQLDPDNPIGYKGRARYFYHQRDLKKALANLDIVIRLRPNDADALTNRGATHYEEKRYKEALADLTRAIELDPNNATARRNRAEVLVNDDDKSLRNPVQALRDAKIACQLEEWKSAYTITVLASAYAANKNWTLAIKSQADALSIADKANRDEYTKTLDAYKAHAEKKKGQRNEIANAP
jgi:tetratricopeptide (TPR) repeat protein